MLVDLYRPIVYIPKESQRKMLIEVLYEVHDSYAMLWYHWPFDDHMGHEDYEPVILFFKNNYLRAIGIRPHQSNQYFERYLTERNRPVVVFESPWHCPHIITGGIADPFLRAYASSRFALRIEEYALVNKAVPEWFVKGGSGESIYEFAKRVSLRLL